MTEKKISKSDEIWNKINDLKIDLYSLGLRPVSRDAERLELNDDVLHIKLKAPTALPLIEEAMKSIRLSNGEKLEIEQLEHFIIIKGVVDPDMAIKKK